ncbi:MAG: hypothetical protein ABJE47_07945 [bacterium]
MGRSVLQQAFEEMRFGSTRTLNLRASLPSASEAAQRTEKWLRQHQVQQSGELLIITGRGNNSDAGVSKVREATMRVLHELRRKGVVNDFTEHNAGAFIVTVAPFKAMFAAASRRREQTPLPSAASPATLSALDDETRHLLRTLADRSLDALGVRDRWSFVESEMLRLFGTLAATVGSGADREQQLRMAIITAIGEYD